MTRAISAAQAATDPWNMKVGGGGGGGEYKLCPVGNYAGTIVHLFDIGTQRVPQMNGDVRDIRRLIVVFELKKRDADGKPFFLGQRYTLSLHEKAHLYQMVVNVLGAKFQNGDQFSIAKLLGKAVMVNVTHSSKGSGPDAKTYHNVGGISDLAEDLKDNPPQPTVKPSLWSVTEGTPFPAGLDYLPWIYGQSIADQAEASAEWKARNSAYVPPARGDDDIPF